jgi:hypothetical protein
VEYDFGLLRTRSERPRRRAADQRDELAPPHGRPPDSSTDIVAVQTNILEGAIDVRFGSLARLRPKLCFVRFGPIADKRWHGRIVR